jgi:hypothetical protein
MTRTSVGTGLSILALAACTGCASLTGGEERLPPPNPAIAGCSPAVSARLQYLEPRLVAHARYADRWWWIWNGVHATGLVYGSAMAATEDDGGEQALSAVDATKSAIGLAHSVIDPPALRTGMDDVRAIELVSETGCVTRLHAAEDLLYAAAEEAHEERRGWKSHAGNLALNLIGAVVVAEGFDESSGWGAGALGFVVGEIETWTFPWHAERTAAEYEHLFPRDGLSAPRWRTEERGDDTVMILD